MQLICNPLCCCANSGTTVLHPPVNVIDLSFSTYAWCGDATNHQNSKSLHFMESKRIEREQNILNCGYLYGHVFRLLKNNCSENINIPHVHQNENRDNQWNLRAACSSLFSLRNYGWITRKYRGFLGQLEIKLFYSR